MTKQEANQLELNGLDHLIDNKKHKALAALELIAPILPTPLYWHDTSGIVLGVNELCLQAMGATREKIIGKTPYEFYPKETAEYILKHHEKVILDGKIMSQEECIEDITTGKIKYFTSIKAPLYDNAGKVIGIIGTSIDITAKKEAENLRLNNQSFELENNTQEITIELEAHKNFKNIIENNLSHATQTKKSKVLEALELVAPILPALVYWHDTTGVVLGANDICIQGMGTTREKIIGKTPYEFYPKGTAEHILKHNEKVILNGKIMSQEECIEDITTGEVKYFTSIKAPLYDNAGKVIGIIGTSINITAEKEAEKLKLKNQRLELENKTQKISIELEAHKKFRKIVDQMIHDMGTPLAALDILISNCTEIPEETRINIREALSRINGITGNVLNQYRAEKSGSQYDNKYEIAEPVMLSSVLMQLISERRQQHPILKFIHDFPNTTTFAFINTQPLEFQRMISNIINNSVDALGTHNGNITLRLNVTDKLANIIIEDNGKGMSQEVLDKILNNIEVTDGKANGHGIGMGQVRDTLANNNGKFSIESQIGKGTKVILTFPIIKAPNWIAEKIELYNDDLVIILDDDSSIHGAWDQRFKNEAPNLRLKHFTEGDDVVSFINDQTVETKQKIFLLTDFELLKQNLNGLDVIEQTGLKRSILVTSHYANSEVQKLAQKAKTRILPKRAASVVPILAGERPLNGNDNTKLKMVDLVILDDDKFLGEILVTELSKNKIVDYYSDADELLNNISQYPKDTIFSLDNQLPNTSGFEVAQKLHDLGFTRLYMLSGEAFSDNQIPAYLTVLMKSDANVFSKLNNL